jgi:hypothetical protein
MPDGDAPEISLLNKTETDQLMMWLKTMTWKADDVA